MCCVFVVIFLMVDISLLSARPRYRKKKAPHSSELSIGSSNTTGKPSSDAPAMLVPSLAPSRSIREAIQEVQMVQVYFFIPVH